MYVAPVYLEVMSFTVLKRLSLR